MPLVFKQYLNTNYQLQYLYTSRSLGVTQIKNLKTFEYSSTAILKRLNGPTLYLVQLYFSVIPYSVIQNIKHYNLSDVATSKTYKNLKRGQPFSRLQTFLIFFIKNAFTNVYYVFLTFIAYMVEVSATLTRKMSDLFPNHHYYGN